jgi:hypothetical protein
MSDDQQADEQTPEPRDADLGETGEKALKAERARANAAERNLRALQTQYDAAVAESAALKDAKSVFETQLADKDLTLTKYKVGVTKGLPEALIARLQGADEDSIAADADELMKFMPAPSPTNHNPRPDPSQGAKSPGATSLESQFAAAMGPLLNNP